MFVQTLSSLTIRQIIKTSSTGVPEDATIKHCSGLVSVILLQYYLVYELRSIFRKEISFLFTYQHRALPK